MTNKLSLLAILLSLVVISSCKKPVTIIPNEEELITTVNYTLTPAGGGTTVTMTFTDLDGEGGNDAVITSEPLAANTTYNGTLELLNEAETPAEDITAEIQEEDEDHQFFFQSTETGTSIAYADMDADGKPVGLESTLTTSVAGMGKLTIILKHEPQKDAAGVSGGDITNAGGETDIELTFDLDVQ